MHRRAFVGGMIGGPLALAGLRAGGAGPQPVRDRLARIPLSSVKLRGRIGRALDLSVRNRLAAQDWRRLVDAFATHKESRCWQTEFWGKWFTAAAPAYLYTGDARLRAALEQSTRGVIANQGKDGYIG